METKEQKIERLKVVKIFIKKESAFLKWLKNKKKKSKYDKEHLKYWGITLKNAKQEYKQIKQQLKELELEEQC